MLFVAPESEITHNELVEFTHAQLTEGDRALLGIVPRFIRPEDVNNITCGQLKAMITPGYLE